MVEELAQNLYRIVLPLPNNPLRSINAYLIRGAGRFLLIDTGMNRKACADAMAQALVDLKVDLARTDFFVTHIHADHMGQLSGLATPGSTIYINEVESKMVFTDEIWHRACVEALAYGFEENELDELRNTHPNRKYGFKGGASGTFRYLADGDRIEIAGYRLECLFTPGHSPGHLCLYDPVRRILFSGDHVLPEITSYIGMMGMLRMDDPLACYLKSLDRVKHLEVDLVLPGHRQPFQDHRDRIAQLLRHHDTRLNEIVSILEGGQPQTAWQIASKMTWDYRADWRDFPVQQKWFAMSEALSHLTYLENRKRVVKHRLSDVWVYSAPAKRRVVPMES